MILRGYDLDKAFDIKPYEHFADEPKPALQPQQKAKPQGQAEAPYLLVTDNEFTRTLIERADSRQNIKYGLAHSPAANVKLYNASQNPDASIAISFSQAKEQYDDIFKIVKRPTGGYELHLKNINTVVVDGKRIDVSSLAKFL